MDYESKALEVARRYNAGEGNINISELCEEIGLGERTFYKYVKRLGIERVGDKYIIPDKQIEGQLNLLEKEGPVGPEEPEQQEQEQGDKPETTEREETRNMEQEKKENVQASQARETSEKEKQVTTGEPALKKKTFEIEEYVEKAVKIQAALEEKTINEYVNDTLKASISEEVKKLIK
jgi:predicted HicB family RNase H-like nuclease